MKIKILATIALCSMLISCNDYFDLERDRPDTPEWQTVGNIESMLTSTYKFLFANGAADSPLGVIPNYTEVVSDMSVINPDATWTFGVPFAAREGYPFNQSDYPPGRMYSEMYKSISSANTVIAFVQDVRDGKIDMMNNLNDVDSRELGRICGEAHFMRAYAYWMLSLAFMPPYSTENHDTIYLPYIVKRYYTDVELASPPMGTMGMIYDLMKSDFSIAKSELEAMNMSKDEIQSERRGRANQYAASAMLMRLYFVSQNWSEALIECDYIESAGIFNLSEQPIRAFNRNIDSPAVVAQEVIFEAAYTLEGSNANVPVTIGRLSKVGKMASYNKDVSGAATDINWLEGGRGSNWLQNAASALYWNPKTLYQIGWAVDDTDTALDSQSFKLSDEAAADLRCTQLHYFLKPFVSKKGKKGEEDVVHPSTTWDALWCDKYLRGPIPMYSQIPLIRYPEVLLTKASCLIQSNGDNSLALAAVNDVRERAFGSSTYNLSGTITEDDVEKERIKELAFEMGDRLTYLAAMRRSLQSIGKKVTPASSSEVPVIEHPYNNFFIELPRSETDFSGTAGEATDNY